jgi:hypothetical protein
MCVTHIVTFSLIALHKYHNEENDYEILIKI